MSNCIKLLKNVYLVHTEAEMKQACNDAQNFNYKPTEFDAFITNEVKSYPAIIVMQRQNNGHAMTVQQLPISEHIIDQIVKEHDGHTN